MKKKLIQKGLYGFPVINISPKEYLNKGAEVILNAMEPIGKVLTKFATAPLHGATSYTTTGQYRTKEKAKEQALKEKAFEEKVGPALSPSNHVIAWTQGSINPKTGLQKLAEWGPLALLGSFVADAAAFKYVPKGVKAAGKNGKAYLISREINKATKNAINLKELSNLFIEPHVTNPKGSGKLVHYDNGDGKSVFRNSGASIKDGKLVPGQTTKNLSNFTWWNKDNPYLNVHKTLGLFSPSRYIVVDKSDLFVHPLKAGKSVGQSDGAGRGFILPNEMVSETPVDISNASIILRSPFGWWEKVKVQPSKSSKLLRVVSEGTYPIYRGKQHSVREVVNPDGTVNPRQAIRILHEVSELFPGSYKMEHRLENPEWHKNDPTTYHHTKNVAQSAWYIDPPLGFTKQDLMIAALGHDFGKIVAGDGHAQIGADLAKLVFPDMTEALYKAIAEHMGTPETSLGKATKAADITNGREFNYLQHYAPDLYNLFFGNTIYRVTLPDGKIRLQLPSHTALKPREITLEPQGDNKYYVHMRTWDDAKNLVPASNLSNLDKQNMFEAVYNELPEGAEILLPKSGPENYATRGTIAGLQRLSRDPRFRPGSKGVILYTDKNGNIKQYNGSSYIKKPDKLMQLEKVFDSVIDNGFKYPYRLPDLIGYNFPKHSYFNPEHLEFMRNVGDKKLYYGFDVIRNSLKKANTPKLVFTPKELEQVKANIEEIKLHPSFEPVTPFEIKYQGNKATVIGKIIPDTHTVEGIHDLYNRMVNRLKSKGKPIPPELLYEINDEVFKPVYVVESNEIRPNVGGWFNPKNNFRTIRVTPNFKVDNISPTFIHEGLAHASDKLLRKYDPGALLSYTHLTDLIKNPLDPANKTIEARATMWELRDAYKLAARKQFKNKYNREPTWKEFYNRLDDLYNNPKNDNYNLYKLETINGYGQRYSWALKALEELAKNEKLANIRLLLKYSPASLPIIMTLNKLKNEQKN